MHTKSYFLALAIAAGSVACSGTEAETPSPAVETARTIPVRTATVQTRDLVETLSLTGTLDPRSEVTVVPEISARLQRVLKTEGDRVVPRSIAGRSGRRRFPPVARSRAGASRRGSGQPRARASGAGPRRQPGEDRRNHRQRSSLGQGRGAGRRRVGVPGEERARNHRAADRTDAQYRRRSAAESRSGMPTQGPSSPPEPRCTPSSTIRCSNSARRSHPAISVR